MDVGDPVGKPVGQQHSQRAGPGRALEVAQRGGQAAQHAVVQGDGPGAAQVVAHRRVGGLQRVVPVAVAVSGQVRAGDGAGADDGQRAGHMLGQRRRFGRGRRSAVERQHLVQQAGVSTGQQVIGQRHQRPEDDVAVRIVGPAVRITRVEHEPLRPVAIGVLRRKDPAQQVAQCVKPAQRQQQLGGALADIAGAPAATGELLQPTRGEVVHQRVVRQPGQPVGQLAQSGAGVGGIFSVVWRLPVQGRGQRPAAQRVRWRSG